MSQPFRPHPTPGDYGQRWGEGAARCFSLEGDFDEDEGLRLSPIPESFICPMTQNVMEDPVMTVDGCTYERSYIEQWIRHRQQQRLRVTSPLTNQELPSHRLLSLTALRKAIEAYLAHRPELAKSQMCSRSFEEAAQLLQGDLLEKQQMAESTKDELSLLRDSNEVLFRALHQAEGRIQELETTVNVMREELLKERGISAGLEEAKAKLDGELAAAKEQLQRVEGARSGASLLSMPRKDAAKLAPGHWVGFLAILLLLVVMAPAIHRHSRHILWPMSAPMTNPVLTGSFPQHEDILPMPMSPLQPPQNDSEARSDPAKRGSKKERKRKASKAKAKSQESSVSKDTPRVDFFTEDLAMNAELEKLADAARNAGDYVEDEEAILKQVELLYDGSLDEKTEAALVLGVLAATSQDSQVSIVRAGAVAPLVDLLRSSAPEARGQAAVALKTLAANNTYNKVVIVRAGAIPLLIRLLKDDSLEVQEVAEGALQLLAEFNNQVEIAQAGAIVPLVALLKDPTPAVREEAAGALVILSLNADNQVAIAQVGAIPMLVDLLQDTVAEVREQAAAALRNLAAENSSNQREIAKAGALSPLTDLVKDDRPSVRKEALGALRNMAVQNPASEVPTKVAAAVAGQAIQDAAEEQMPKAVPSGSKLVHTAWG
mmetsp:Transcript_66893/g.160162  ORF Transcript_66893/g.160162 Transcript_66893/m.160162 type:complete len:659 (+) Transcript_66893:143-2119(+)